LFPFPKIIDQKFVQFFKFKIECECLVNLCKFSSTNLKWNNRCGRSSVSSIDLRLLVNDRLLDDWYFLPIRLLLAGCTFKEKNDEHPRAKRLLAHTNLVTYPASVGLVHWVVGTDGGTDLASRLCKLTVLVSIFVRQFK
jgi:hypothetical protein